MASDTTRRIADGSLVDWPDALAVWAAAARPVLERAATTYGSYLTYQQLADAVQEEAGIETGVPFRHWIGTVLGAVARDRRSPDEPMLTSLVVHADGTIGDGYAIPVEERDGAVPADLELHAATERLACHRYFGSEMPPDGGKPIFTAKVASKREWARKTKAPVRREVCPTCFLELPMTGVCDTCDV